MKKIALFVLTIGMSVLTMAQSNKVAHTLKGKVVDASTNRPVSYTNIGLEGTLLGTASDADGNFELKIPESMEGKPIYFSAVGYTNQQFPVKNLFSKKFCVIKLQAQSYGVGEVDVAAQNMVLIRILRMASENIKYNYGVGPFNMHFKYTNTKTASNGTSPKSTTATVLLYDKTGYSVPSKIDAFKARNYSVEKENTKDDYSFASSQLDIDDLLNLDWARSASCILNPGLLNDYSLSLESQPKIDGQEYWVIAFSQKRPTLEASGDYYATAFSGKITIKKDDYSVLQIEGTIASTKNNRQGRSLAVNNTTNCNTSVNYTFKVNYEGVALKRVTMDKKYTTNNQQYAEQSILDMTRIHANNITTIGNRDYFAGE